MNSEVEDKTIYFKISHAAIRNIFYTMNTSGMLIAPFVTAMNKVLYKPKHVSFLHFI